MPYYKGEHLAFDMVPAVVEFEVNQGSVVIEEPFQVAGFSVYGKVVNKKGVRLSVCLSVSEANANADVKCEQGLREGRQQERGTSVY